MATTNVSALKIVAASGDWPATNMWWPQTRKPTRAMATLLIGDEAVAEDVLAR